MAVHVVRDGSSRRVKDVLSPLNEEEFQEFKRMLIMLRKSDRTDAVAVSAFIVDILHSDHMSELGTVMSLLANKLTNDPFMGDRETLKDCLEGLMRAVHMEEQINEAN